MAVKVAVIYYSATGTVHALAEALADGAESVGAQVRLRRVAELAPEGAIDQSPLWRQHVDAVAASVSEASLDDLVWADAYAFGTPTRFGAPSAQLKQFIDQTDGLWRDGTLADKPVTAFTSAFNRHGGNEATILSLGNVFYHWGSLIVPPGFVRAAERGRTRRRGAGRRALPRPAAGGDHDPAAGGQPRHRCRCGRREPPRNQGRNNLPGGMT
jgi:NAD(P)H dehydrogenase (quinone)